MKIYAGTYIAFDDAVLDCGHDLSLLSFKVLRDFDQKKVCDEFWEQWQPSDTSAPWMKPEHFVKWLCDSEIIEPVAPVQRWTIGDAEIFKPEIEDKYFKCLDPAGEICALYGRTETPQDGYTFIKFSHKNVYDVGFTKFPHYDQYKEVVCISAEEYKSLKKRAFDSIGLSL